jgi:hypothetical protein
MHEIVEIDHFFSNNGSHVFAHTLAISIATTTLSLTQRDIDKWGHPLIGHHRFDEQDTVADVVVVFLLFVFGMGL